MRNATEGRGFSVDDLHSAQLDNMRAKVLSERPELLELGRKTLAMQIRAERDMEKLRVELHRAFGGDGVRMALDLLRREAESAVNLEEATALRERELEAIAKAQAVKAAKAEAEALARVSAPQPQQNKSPQSNHQQTRR